MGEAGDASLMARARSLLATDQRQHPSLSAELLDTALACHNRMLDRAEQNRPAAVELAIAGADLLQIYTGFIYHGPSGHYFYNWLDKQIPGTDAVPVFTKVAVDQLFWCPIFMSVFFTYLGLVNGDSLNTIGNKIKNDLLTACQGSWKVWPLVHLINFKFVPNKWRIPYINAIQIAFNMFLSLLGSKKA